MNPLAKEFYEKNRGEKVAYKGVYNKKWSVAGYTDTYVIIGSYDCDLCIRSFSRFVETVDERNPIEDICYNSYRFAKPKNLTIT